MAVRSLTSVFIMMRNNALQNKHLGKGDNDGYYDDDDDTVALVGTGKQKYKKLKQTEIQVSFEFWFHISTRVLTPQGTLEKLKKAEKKTRIAFFVFYIGI